MQFDYGRDLPRQPHNANILDDQRIRARLSDRGDGLRRLASSRAQRSAC